jgi:hypothetical protein
MGNYHVRFFEGLGRGDTPSLLGGRLLLPSTILESLSKAARSSKSEI